MRSILTLMIVGLALCAFAGPTQAATITFDGLSGGNLDPFTSYDEGTFTVTSSYGAWLEAHSFGNPTPALVGATDFPTSTITVTENSTGFFTFAGVDLADANGIDGPKVTYLFEGLLNGTPVFTTPGGPLDPIGTFLTIPSADSGSVIDELRISLTSTNAYLPFNVDNIQVQVDNVPEPGTAILLGLGILGLGGVVYRRRRAA